MRISSIDCRICTALTVLVLLGAVTRSTVAQQERPFRRNAVYIEGLGQGILYSINYEHRLTPHISLRAGFTHWSLPFIFIFPLKVGMTGFPIMGNYLSGKSSHHLELGIGAVPFIVTVPEQTTIFGTELKGEEVGVLILGTTTIGYRYQPRGGGFVFRIGFTPLFPLSFEKVLLSGGISLGYAF
ncbi:MAG: hypothetical protein ACP5JH_09620 [Bacteroidota bacterium]